MSSSDFIIWGARGHGKVLRDLIECRGGRVMAFVDNDPAALGDLGGTTGLFGIDALSDYLSDKDPGAFKGAIGVGGGRGRDRLYIRDEFLRLGVLLPELIHPKAVVEAGAKIGSASQVMAGSVIGAGARLGKCCIVNHGAIVDHETELEDGVHVAPGATLCGCISVGRNAFVGAGATILPRLKIGENVVVGAGAVVTKDVRPNETVVGNPAQVLRK